MFKGGACNNHFLSIDLISYGLGWFIKRHKIKSQSSAETATEDNIPNMQHTPSCLKCIRNQTYKISVPSCT